MDDYPSDGEQFSYFLPTEPESQTKERKANKAAAQANKKLIDSVVNRLTERIAFYTTLHAIPDRVLKHETEFRIAVAANKQTVANLEIELNYWKGQAKMTQ